MLRRPWQAFPLASEMIQSTKRHTVIYSMFGLLLIHETSCIVVVSKK